MFSVRPKQLFSMRTRDGVRLDADVYYPDSSGEFPVLLMRQPYGRAIASTVVYAHPSWYAAHGYIVVVQDVRGRGTSEGSFDLFAHEIEDGLDTVKWVADLLQSDGQVGMYGFSYQGMTQLFAAATRHPALKTICPAMVAYDLYHDWAYEGGAFCYQLNLAWAIQLAAETARRKSDTESYQLLYALSRNLPLTDPVSPRSSLLKQLTPDSHYHQWLERPPTDDYWQKRSPKFYLQDVDLPMLHIGGWFDTHLRGTLNSYKAIASRSRLPQHLLVGPWGHLPWSRKVGAIDYGAEANSPIDRLQLRWFDHFLKGIDTGLLDEPPITLFEMGSNQWRKFKTFPTNNQKSYFLVTTGLAAMDDRQGTLTPSPLHLPSALISSSPAIPDTVVHDPWRPVPSLGGHSAFPAGPFERSSVDGRSDVLTYTSAPLESDLHLAGDITLDLYGVVDAPSFDLCAVVSEVRSDGQVYNFTQGYVRVQPLRNGNRPEENSNREARQENTDSGYPAHDWGDDQDAAEPRIELREAERIHQWQQEVQSSPLDTLSSPPTMQTTSMLRTPVSLTLQSTCICLPKGSAIRLSLSGACSPAYAVNPGTGDPLDDCRLIDARVITMTIYGDGDRPSHLQLPIELGAV